MCIRDSIKSVETEIGKLESLGKSAIIITSPIVRMYFKDVYKRQLIRSLSVWLCF